MSKNRQKSGNFWIQVDRHDGKREVWIDVFLTKKQSFKDGLWHGKLQHYSHQSRQIAILEEWKAGRLDGIFREYHPNSGLLICMGEYKNGKRNGLWVYSGENGLTKKNEIYKDGELIKFYN